MRLVNQPQKPTQSSKFPFKGELGLSQDDINDIEASLANSDIKTDEI